MTLNKSKWTSDSRLAVGRRSFLALCCSAAIACSGVDSGSDDYAFTEIDPEHAAQPDYDEGVAADDGTEGADLDSGGDRSAYQIPNDLPELENPEIIVSLSQPLVMHVFDRETGFSEVYPVGVGTLNSAGVSITPKGHFSPGTSNVGNNWYWVKRRSSPAYFGGFPFLRLSIKNRHGNHTYGMHGPITQVLKQSFVSHGCIRMRGDDIVDIFWMLRNRRQAKGGGASLTPISIVRGKNLDRDGNVLQQGDTAELWDVGEPINWASMASAPRPSWRDPAWGQ